MELKQFRLDGRTALVTGGGSGLGEGIARRFASVGADVTILDLNGEAGAAVAASIRADGGKAHHLAADVTSEEAVKSAIDSTASRTGRLDVVVNMAGIGATRRIVDMDEAHLDTLYAIHLKGTIWGTKHAIRVMAAAGTEGAIINCSSAAMDVPAEGLGMYAAMKSAIASISRTAAKEVGKQNIRCNVIAPGLIITPLTNRHGLEEDGSFNPAKYAAFVDRQKAGNALDRMGDVDDIADAALYLASDASKYVTGQVLRVNGGVAMR